MASWNQQYSAPNWSGNKSSSAPSNVSTLNVNTLNADFISSAVASISSITANNISSTTASISSIIANSISTPVAFISSINGTSIESFNSANWWQFPAQGTVTATLGPFSAPQYDITGFRNINCRTLTTTQNVECGNTINAVLANIGGINCPDILMSPGDKAARLDVYGTSLVAGNNALFVEGGTTLTGGGVIHGVTIGALRDSIVTGLDLVRIDVLPAGLALNSATFITQNAGGAINLAAGGALSLSGGSYIEYNSDEHRFINTTAGNDFTDIYVGNIHAAYGGSAPLRINDASRGVELANVNSMTMTTQLPIANWSNATNYAVNNKVRYIGLYYNALFPSLNLQPNIPIPAFNNALNYAVNNIVFVSGAGAFRCIIPVVPPPAWAVNTQYAVSDKVERLGSYYDALFFGRGVDPSVATVPAWDAGTSYNNTDVISYSGSTYRCVGFPAPGTAPLPPIANWNLLFANTNTSNIWAPFSPTAITPPNANWTLIGATNAITQVWPLFTPYKATITGDEVSEITIGNVIGASPISALYNFNYLDLYAQTGSDATIFFNDSLSNLQSKISIDNNVKRLTIRSDTGLSIQSVNSNTTDFNDGIVERIQTLNLTSTLFPQWNSTVVYGSNAEASYGPDNWVSQFADNTKNTPLATLDDWNTSGSYPPGAVRYYAPNGNAYICILSIFGVSMPDPPSDPTHWSTFQVGNNGEDVWFPSTAPVTSVIVGDKISEITIGNQSFINGLGNYLTINNTFPGSGEPIDATQDAAIVSPGSLGLVGGTGVQLASIGGPVNIFSDFPMQIFTFPGSGANMEISSDGDLGLGAQSNIVVGSTGGNVAIGSSTGSVLITSDLATTITSANEAITLTSELATSITSGTAINLTSAEATSITSTGNTVNITGNTGVNINSPEAISITSSAGDVDISAGTGCNVTVNRTLDMTNNNIINVSSITGSSTLTLATTNGNLNLTAGGSGNRINVTTDAQFNNRTLFNFSGTNVGGIFGLTTQPLNLVGQQTIPAVAIRGSLTLWSTATVQAPGNSISGVTTLNGRNIFSYGNFYNTATQTLGAANTATRIRMNTSANNNLITLDSTTNIGRLTFTNAGVYNVVWNAYLFHGSGGAVKSCIWIRLNGTDVAGSGKTEDNDNQLNETNLTSSTLINATAGQYIEFFWAANGTGVPLTAVAASAPSPATPSFSCTINIVG